MRPAPSEIATRYHEVLARLRRAAEMVGRDPDAFRVVAVSKGVPIQTVAAARSAGITRFGENRVQEALAKVAALPDVEWHLVGRLQSNKARTAVRAFAAIHSVDSVALLERVAHVADDEGRRPALLLQVNVTGEPSKAGFAPEVLSAGEVLAALRAFAARMSIVGLMTIGPASVSGEESRRVFARLRLLRDALRAASGLALPELSMGMSGDAEAAVAEGATLVRIGTAIFGPRAAP
jgi:pyridoxal phosphate enzyme (YggS family)